MKIIILFFVLSASLFGQYDIAWERIDNPISDGTHSGSGFTSFHIGNNGVFYIIGNWAENAYSTDKGETWKVIDNTGKEFNSDGYFDMRSLNDGRLVSELQTKYYYSEDTAKTWEEIELPSHFVQGFGDDNSGKMWVGAADGLVYTTNFTDWHKVDKVRGRIHCLEINNNQILAGAFNVGFAEEEFGTRGELFYSDDGGKNWEKMLLQYEWFEQAIIFDENTMVVSVRREGGTGQGYRTVNGGDSWETISLNDVVVGFTKINKDTAFAVLANMGPVMTTDKGLTWQPIGNGIISTTNRFRLPIIIHPEGDMFLSDLTGAVWKANIKMKKSDQNALLAPVLENPKDKSSIKNALTLEWNSTNAEEYEIMVSENLWFEQPKIFNSNDNSLNDLDLDKSKNYYWKVRSINGDEKSNWSQSWSFEYDGLSNIRQLIERKDIIITTDNVIADNLTSDLTIYDILGNKINSFNKGYSGKLFGQTNQGIYFITIGDRVYKIYR